MTEQTVHLALYETLADWEYGHAIAALADRQLLREPGGFRLRTVAVTDQLVTSMGGARIAPDMTFDQLDPSDSAMLILPGSAVPCPESIEKARAFIDAGTPVAAICGATIALAAAGLLDDRDHTGPAAEVLASTGYRGAQRYRDQRAVNDRSVITAGPTEPVSFAREILAELDAYDGPVLDAWYGLHSTGDPRYFHALMEASA